MNHIKKTLDALAHSEHELSNEPVEVSTLRKKQVGPKEQKELLHKIKALRKSHKQAAKILKDLNS